jgi:hypothetical protein
MSGPQATGWSAGIGVDGVRVVAPGGFDTSTWQSTRIDCSVEVNPDVSADQLVRPLQVVDQVPETPRAIRAGAVVQRDS